MRKREIQKARELATDQRQDWNLWVPSSDSQIRRLQKALFDLHVELLCVWPQAKAVAK